VTIPSDLRIIRYVQLANTNVSPTANVYLEKKDTSYMTEYYNTPSTASGLPKYYGNWDAVYWVVSPTPDAAYEITMAYIKQPDSITTSDSTTTYLSNKYQDFFARSIWILERAAKYGTVLSTIVSTGLAIVCDRTTRS
jgi:hypothetical protein